LISTQAEYDPQGLTPRGERKDAKHARFGENRKIFFFAGLVQPKVDPSQPEADPSSGGLWRSLGLPARRAYSPEGAINFVEVVPLNISKART